MIQFACDSCGMKFQVKDEFAGRSTSCVTCKRPLVVPPPDETDFVVPAERIEGASSSLAQGGIDTGVTVDQSHAYVQSGTASVAKVLESRTRKHERYLLEGEIARGGMGAVLRAIDCDLRREVAVKFMLSQADAKKKIRFVEEAQITGQLEHPNIVPIHEVGLDSQQRLFFSMKLVQGRSLAQVFKELRGSNAPSPEGKRTTGLSVSPKDAEKQYPLSRLLTVFVNVCNALAYAHSRRVIHRDLKPSNIMIGEFGEVYVMDWGLAKVLGEEPDEAKENANPNAYFATLATQAAPRGSGVRLDKDHTEALTQEGAVLGTPAYMPPEQARGDLHAIDERSDIYALGAILYAILTLEAPVDRSGDVLAILLRVAQGEIQRPEVRTPTRNIPPELSAIAMKALATVPANRYQSVEMLRRDVELYLAGRTVSAKQDTIREQAWKLAKRNRGASFALGIGLIVLLGVLVAAFGVNYAARLHAEQQQSKAEDAFAKFEKAQKEKEAAMRRSVPALVRAGQQLVNENQIELAEEQVRLALSYDPKNLDARLLKGQILVAQKQWRPARRELDSYLRQRPKNYEAILVLNAITNGKPEDGPTLLHLIESLQRQKVSGLAALLMPDLDKIFQSKAKLLPLYRQQIEAHWKGQGGRLTLTKDGEFRLNLENVKQVADLSPLTGLKLDRLSLRECRQITDLSGLKGMPLRSLDLVGCQMQSLEPLRGMPLESLDLWKCDQIADLGPLQKMKLKRLSINGCVKVTDIEPLRGMPLEYLALNGCAMIRDLGALNGMPLEFLQLDGCASIVDLAPLRGCPIQKLHMHGCSQIPTLDPLKGMPLTLLHGRYLHLLKDIEALRDMPLTNLQLDDCTNIRDIEPLRGMKLTSLHLSHSTKIESLEPIRNMPLTVLNISGTRVKNLEPLVGMPLQRLAIGGAFIKDLSPIKDIPLQFIELTPRRIEKNLDVVIGLKTLTTVQVGYGRYFTPAEFWKRYKAGEFAK